MMARAISISPSSSARGWVAYQRRMTVAGWSGIGGWTIIADANDRDPKARALMIRPGLAGMALAAGGVVGSLGSGMVRLPGRRGEAGSCNLGGVGGDERPRRHGHRPGKEDSLADSLGHSEMRLSDDWRGQDNDDGQGGDGPGELGPLVATPRRVPPHRPHQGEHRHDGDHHGETASGGVNGASGGLSSAIGDMAGDRQYEAQDSGHPKEGRADGGPVDGAPQQHCEGHGGERGGAETGLYGPPAGAHR